MCQHGGSRRRDLEKRYTSRRLQSSKPEGVRCTAGRPSEIQMTLTKHARRLFGRVSGMIEAQDPHEELSQVIITRTLIL